MSDSHTPQHRIFWSEEEFQALALSLIACFPDRPFAQARALGDLKPLSAADLRLAQQRSTLPPERHRPFPSHRVKDSLLIPLLKALAQLRGDTGTPPSSRPAREVERYSWDEAEWDKFARLLVERHPALRTTQETAAAVSIREMNEVMALMPRPRAIASHGAIQLRLRAALDRLDAKPAPEPEPEAETPPFEAGSKVKWNEREWDEMGRRLADAYPQLHLPDSPDMAGLTAPMFNAVAATMTRPRTVKQLVSTRPLLARTYARGRTARFHRAAPPAPVASKLDTLLDNGKPKFTQLAAAAQRATEARQEAPPSAAAQLAELFAPKPAPVTAAEPAADAKPNALAGGATGARDALAGSNAFAKVHWTREEWVILAAELHRMFPGKDYPHRDDVVGLNSQDVAFAQRVLPFNRQRRHVKVVSFPTLRGNLIAAFKDLRNRLASAALLAEREAQQAQQAQQAQEQQLAAAAIAAPAAAAEVATAPIPADRPLAVAAGMNPYEAAFAPLMALMARQVADQVTERVLAELRPQMVNMAEAIIARLTTVAAVAAVPAVPASPAKLELVAARPAPIDEHKPKRLTVGVLGNRNSYKAELEKDFPGVDFTCIDNGKELPSIRNADKVVCMIRFVAHRYYHKAKSLAGDRFMPIDGGVSDLKRVLTAWVNGAEMNASKYLARQPGH